MLALVRLCRKFGQNQRSLFSFFASRELHGFASFLLQEILRETVPCYTLPDLYDYVGEALGAGLGVGEGATRWAEVQTALERAASATCEEINLIKAIGLLSAIGAYGEMKPSTEVLRFGSMARPIDFNRQKVSIGADVYISVSIKTSGPMPPDYSILSIDACVVRHPEQSFYVELKPLNSNAVPEVLAANKMVLKKLEKTGLDPQEAILRFVEWVREMAGFGRPVFVGSTATLDWSFINWYAHKFAESNPFGYGAVDIRTYEMTRQRCSWGAVSLIEDHGELNFLRNQSCYSAFEQAQLFRESSM